MAAVKHSSHTSISSHVIPYMLGKFNLKMAIPPYEYIMMSGMPNV